MKKITITLLCGFTFLSIKPADVTAGNIASNSDEKLTGTDYGESDSCNLRNLDEVIVVSQPKESNLLRFQPMASSIFSSTETSNLGIKGISDLSAYVPAFQMPDYGSRLTSSMYIRGIGSRINNPAVGVYLDGMPILSKSAFNSHIYQIDRVDILRGPQGTLYGMNTEGGLVRLYSKNPLSNKGTDIKLGIGSHLYRNFEIANYSLISPNTGISLAAFYNGENGFQRNSTTGKRADNYNEAGARIRLVNEFSNKLTLDFTADYQYVNQNGFPYGILNVSNNHTSSPEMNRESDYKRNMLNSALNIRYIENGWTLSSTTSYQLLSDRMNMDQDYTSLDYMHLRQNQLQNGITQEFDFKGSTKKWKYASGIFGSYQWLRTEAPVYFDPDFTNAMATTIQNAMYNAMVETMAKNFSSIPGMTDESAMQMALKTIERAGGVNVNSLSMSVPGIFHTPQLNLGIFHESTINFTDNITMTVGLRYDFSHEKIDYATSAIMKVGVNVMGHEATSQLRSALDKSKCNTFNQVLPKLGFTWTINDNGSNIYALVNKGYRSGGFNIQMFSDILQSELRANSNSAMKNDFDINHTEEDYKKINKTIEYKPEYCWNYELGTHLNLFNNSVLADFSTYYMKIRNQQLSVMAGTYGFGRMMINAGRSHTCGIEAAVRGKAAGNNLSWNLTYSYTHSVFDNYKEDGINGTVDYKGKYIPFIPQHMISGAIDWTIPIRNNKIKSVIIGTNVIAQGKIYWDEANTFSQKLYALIGAHADINFNKLSISVWGKNITQTRYNTFALKSSATGTTIYLAQRGKPISCGIDFNYKI